MLCHGQAFALVPVHFPREVNEISVTFCDHSLLKKVETKSARGKKISACRAFLLDRLHCSTEFAH